MAKKKKRTQSKQQKIEAETKQLAKSKQVSKKQFVKNKDKKKPGWKVESINTKAEFTCTGVSYHSIVGVVGKFMLGDKGFEFYNDRNVRDFIQIPWENMEAAGANVHGRRVSRHFEIFTDAGKFLFSSKDSGKILKIIREHIGNEKVIRLRTLVQIIIMRFKQFGHWVSSLFKRK